MTKNQFLAKFKKHQLKVEVTKWKFSQADCIYAIKAGKLMGHYSPVQGGKILNGGRGINFSTSDRKFIPYKK